MAGVMAEAWAQAGAAPLGPPLVQVDRAATQRVAVLVGDVPGFGWAAWDPRSVAFAPVEAVGLGGLRNGRVELQVDPVAGTFAINGHGGLNRIVDEGDSGDSYNFSPVPGDLPVDRPDEVEIEVTEAETRSGTAQGHGSTAGRSASTPSRSAASKRWRWCRFWS